MPTGQWGKTVSAERPVAFEGEGTLELHGCCLAEAGAGASVLCRAEGGEAFALARLTPERPSSTVRARFESGATFSCQGGDVLLVGLQQTAGEERPAKVARTAEAEPAKAPEKEEVKAKAAAKPAEASKPAAEAEASKPAAKAEAAKPKAEAKAEPAKPAAKAEPAKPAAKAEAAKGSAAKREATPTGAKSPAAPASPAKGKEQPPQKTPEKKAPEEPKEAKNPLAAKILPSGLKYEVTKPGRGPETATSGRPVNVRYEGRLAKNGKKFDRGTIKFRLGVGEVIRGWDEGVKGMLKGEKRRLLVPARLGYGSRGAPPAIPPNADLIFEVEYLGN